MRTRIRELRARYDMTQEDPARKVGARKETIPYIEKGRYKHSLKLTHETALALKTTIDELFVFDEDDKEDQDLCARANEPHDRTWYRCDPSPNRARFHHYFDIVGATFFL